VLGLGPLFDPDLGPGRKNPAQAAVEFAEAVESGRQLVGFIQREFAAAGRVLRGVGLETDIGPASNRAAALAVQAGLAATLTSGIVIFHEEISQGLPSIRRLLRKIDRRAGRRVKGLRTPAQKLVALGVKAGRFKRTPSGQFIEPDAVLKGFLRRAKARAASDRRKREIERQKQFDAKLRGFVKKTVLPNIRGAKRRRT